MNCSVLIATSADGYIATGNGDVSWLETAGRQDVDMGEDADMGFAEFLAGVDCIVMGRKTMEKIASFNLDDSKWPYGDLPIFVLSKALQAPPKILISKVEIHNKEISELVSRLEKDGFKNAYIDGGATITAFLNLKLIKEMTITRAPILLGEGIPLFGKLDQPIRLYTISTKYYPNGFVQIRYQVHYD